MSVRSSVSLLGALVALAISTSGGGAHPSLDVKSASSGPLRVALRIPHGCQGSPTVAIKLTIPEGIIGVKPAPKSGWTVVLTKGPYAKSYDYFHGKKVSEGVKEIVWRGGPLLDEHFDEFLFTGFVTDAFRPGDAVAFPVTQECVTGELAWVEVAGPETSPHGMKMPAPVLKIWAQDGTGPAAPIHAAPPATSNAHRH